MCGIVGTFGLADAAILSAMSSALQHRGPDDFGEFLDREGPVGLGHRRLAIMDLSHLGHQPMKDASGRYTLVFNGEIYNFQGIRTELEASGHRFLSETDSEVIVEGYARWGPDSVRRLRGMFAFAIYDAQEKSLFLARDRFGIKPLLFHQGPGIFLFASELRSLLASGLVPRKADRQSLWDFLSLGAVPQPKTLVEGVESLPPGCWVKLAADGARTLRQYWDLALDSARNYPDSRRLTEAEAVDQLRHMLDDATRAHMIADVPVGGFLSGGIDSTAVVGLMGRQTSRRIETYSVGFESAFQHLDELKWASLAAQHLGTIHHEVVVTAQEVADCYSDLVSAIDQPSADGTNAYFVSRAARQTVTVSLSGVGGDELFAGYSHFSRFRDLRASWDRLPITGARTLARFVPGRFWPDKTLAQVRGMDRYAAIRCFANEGQKREITIFGMERGLQPVSRLYREMLRPELDSVAETSYVETRGYMLHTLLRDLDAMSMRFALEVRPPLLDHPLTEFVFSLPESLKLDPAVNKPLLVRCLEGIIPERIIHRPKMGFEMPLFDWLRGPLRSRAADTLSSTKAHQLFNPTYLNSCQNSLQGGKRSRNLWSHVLLIEWLRLHGMEVTI